MPDERKSPPTQCWIKDVGYDKPCCAPSLPPSPQRSAPPSPPVAPVVDGGSCGIGCIVGIAAAVFVGSLLLLACAFLFCFKKAGENGSGIKPGTTKTGSAAESA